MLFLKDRKRNTMILEKGKAIFTTEDNQNMTVKKYTDIEIKNNIKNYTQKSFPRRILLLTGLVISLIFALNCDTNPFSFFSNIIVILFAAGCLLSEIVYHLNRKIAASDSYIEILVEQKKETDNSYQNSATTGPEVFHFYPVIGKDTTTNYKSTWYIDKDVYQNVKTGDIVKIGIGNH